MIALLYIPISVGLARLDAYFIASGDKIYHFLSGLRHCVVAGAMWYFTKYDKVPAWLDDNEWQVVAAVLLIARVFFDVSLNLMRKPALPIDYISPEVKAYSGLRQAIRKGKVIDYLEYKVFGNNGYAPKIIYLFITVILLFA